jgi:hypothetical protein
MARKKNTIVADVHVNAVLINILDRIFDNKEITDDEGNTLDNNERRESIDAFKETIGIN